MIMIIKRNNSCREHINSCRGSRKYFVVLALISPLPLNIETIFTYKKFLLKKVTGKIARYFEYLQSKVQY